MRSLARTYLEAYVDQVHHYVKVDHDESFALRLDNTDGAILEVLRGADVLRVDLLDSVTEVVDHERRFVRGADVRELSKTERGKVERLQALPEDALRQQAPAAGRRSTT